MSSSPLTTSSLSKLPPLGSRSTVGVYARELQRVRCSTSGCVPSETRGNPEVSSQDGPTFCGRPKARRTLPSVAWDSENSESETSDDVNVDQLP
ncbi:hypothetical protein KPH14_008073 [Odynerus spinipes]|uniref:Uncharacterized protein n=1 Tax=Odynerus spinipes TaxID=1348599 RepID=A0AAD9RK81_9HYME|nr:hypothetical protein KPH14_008073 [Odynerus spinipes]